MKGTIEERASLLGPPPTNADTINRSASDADDDGDQHHDDHQHRSRASTSAHRRPRRLQKPPLPKGCLSCTILNAFLMLIAGLLLLLVAPVLLTDYIESILPISNPTSVIFDMWQDSDSSSILTRSFYFFNLTNPEEVYKYHAIPDYKRVGPFVFDERTYNPMDSIFWLPNTSISYKYKTQLVWNEKLSKDAVTGETLDPAKVKIVNVNIPLFAAAYRLSRLPNILLGKPIPLFGYNFTGKQTACVLMESWVYDTIVGPTGVFTKRSVQELLFGYKDEIWDAFAFVGSLMDYDAPTEFRTVWNGSEPAPSPYNWRYGQRCPMWDNQTICNSSAVDPSMAFSGADWHTSKNHYKRGGMKSIGQMTKWAGQDTLAWWGPSGYGDDRNGTDVSGTCDQLKGGNGILYPMGIDESSKPYVFIDAIFRDIQIEYEKHTQVKGIDTLRFRFADDGFTTFNDNSECYDQYYTGIMNLSRPTFGPLYASEPYFMRTNPTQIPRGGNKPETVLNFTVEGVPIADFQKKHKDNSDFATYIDILPVTGTLLEGAARIQSSTDLGPIMVNNCPGLFPQLMPRNISVPTGSVDPKTGKKLFRNVTNSHFPTTKVPIFYLDRHAVVTDALAKRIKDTVILPFMIVGIGGAVFCGICPIVLVIGAFWIRRDRLRRMQALHNALQQVHHEHRASTHHSAVDEGSLNGEDPMRSGPEGHKHMLRSRGSSRPPSAVVSVGDDQGRDGVPAHRTESELEAEQLVAGNAAEA